MEKYQGWANYETWVVALYIDNDEESHLHWRERARDMMWDGRLRRTAIVALAEQIKEEITESEIARRVDGTVYADLLSAALGNVDWREIAESRYES